MKKIFLFPLRGNTIFGFEWINDQRPFPWKKKWYLWNRFFYYWSEILCVKIKSFAWKNSFLCAWKLTANTWNLKKKSTWKNKLCVKFLKKGYVKSGFHTWKKWKNDVSRTLFSKFSRKVWIFHVDFFFNFHVLAVHFRAHKNEFFHARLFIFTHRISNQ